MADSSDALGASGPRGGLRARDWALIGGCAFLAFTLLVVRPFGGASDMPEEELAVAWNRSIARLGITPVFPPEEDFFVGDVLAVVSDSPSPPLLGRSVRVGHIDLRDDMIAEAAARPIFEETVELKAGDEYRHQVDSEVPAGSTDKRLRLTITAFPGLSISHAAHAGSAAGVSLFGIGAARDDAVVEDLRIPVAETYGVTGSRAAGRLKTWCTNPETALFCTDRFARHVLAYTVDPDLLRPVDGAYPTKIALQIVTRVFMTRAIEQQRFQRSARGLAIATRGKPAASEATPGDKPATPESQARDAVSAVQQTTSAASKSGAPSADMANGATDTFRLQQTFQRPVVFGFRSWNLQLTPEIAP